MTFLKSLNLQLMYEGATPATLGIFRAFLYAVWIYKISADPIQYFALFPQETFDPIGPLLLIPQSFWPVLLSEASLLALKWSLIALLVPCMLGLKPFRWLALITAIVLTYHQALVRGFGFINHQELGALFCAYLMVIFPVVDGFKIGTSSPREKEQPHVYRNGLLAISFIMFIPYVAIAAYRVARVAPEVFTGGSLPFWLASLAGLDPDGPNFGIWIAISPLRAGIFKLGFVLVTAMELLTPICLIWPRLRPYWVLVMIPFHLSCHLFMNILFWENVVLISLLFFLAWVPKPKLLKLSLFD